MDQQQTENPLMSFEPSPKRLLVLGLASVVVFFLTLSVPYIISISAFPLVLCFTYYSRIQAGLVSFLALVAVYSLLLTIHSQMALGILPLYLVVIFIAFAVSEIIRRQIRPSDGMKVIGMFLSIVVYLGLILAIESNREILISYFTSELVSLRDQAVAKDENLREQFQSLIDSVEFVINSIPFYGFVSIFLGIWFNLYMMLRGSSALQFKFNYPYRLKDLTVFRMPEWSVYLVIAALALYALPNDYLVAEVNTWSKGFLYVLGSFFFLQGFGIYLDYLNFVNVKGFFRSILIAITVVFANVIISGLGVFDMWFDFRKHFRKS